MTICDIYCLHYCYLLDKLVMTEKEKSKMHGVQEDIPMVSKSSLLSTQFTPLIMKSDIMK